MVKRFLQRLFGNDELKVEVEDLKNKFSDLKNQVNGIDQRVEAIDQRVTTVELQTKTTLRRFGKYKYRTSEELKLMGEQIEDLLGSLEALVERIEFEEGAARARNLLRRLLKRLRNNQGRIRKEQMARG